MLILLLAMLSLSATAAPATAPVVDQPALDRLGWTLACQAYTFREMSFYETLDVLKSLGVRNVEIYPGQRLSPNEPKTRVDHHLSPQQIEQLKQKLRDADVTALSYGVVELKNSGESNARQVFDFARALDLKTIVCEPDEAAAEMLDRLAQEYKINVAIHNHPQPSHYGNCDTVVKFCDGRSQRIGACADVGHWYRSGLIPVECLQKLRGRILELHFKDLSTEKLDVPWGTGQCDVPAMLREIHRQKFPAVIVIEYESTKGQELIDNVAKSIQFLNTVARDLGQ